LGFGLAESLERQAATTVGFDHDRVGDPRKPKCVYFRRRQAFHFSAVAARSRERDYAGAAQCAAAPAAQRSVFAVPQDHGAERCQLMSKHRRSRRHRDPATCSDELHAQSLKRRRLAAGTDE
jgi:hypothetical protein